MIPPTNSEAVCEHGTHIHDKRMKARQQQLKREEEAETIAITKMTEATICAAESK